MRRSAFLSLSPHGFHRVAYGEWGDRDADRTVVCVHGLTRTGRDFDFLAEALAGTDRVVCPDLPGRGESEWLRVPTDYNLATYANDMAMLMARLGVEEVDWIGTSLGGLVGILLAAQPGTPIRRLVINDVGPFVPKDALERIADYVGNAPRFDSLDEVDAYYRRIYTSFGPLTDVHWRHIARHSSREDREAGGYRLHYDPNIAFGLRPGTIEAIEIWPVWDMIRCPTLVLRGATSDVLPADVAEAMQARGPAATLVEWTGIGHAPALMDPDQIATIRDWLRG